jgi:hypothetical protein
MTTEIWKFPLEPDRAGVAVPIMPSIRQPLSVGEQAGGIVLWAAVDPSKFQEPVRHFIVPTGAELPVTAAYFRGTVQMPNGLVFHVWQEG